MRIVDLTEEYHDRYFNCLGDGTSEWSVGTCRKREWFNQVSSRGLRVKLTLDGKGTPIDMIQYGPAGLFFKQDNGLYFLHCIWVLKDNKGEDHQKQGTGKALLEAAEDDTHVNHQQLCAKKRRCRSPDNRIQGSGPLGTKHCSSQIRLGPYPWLKTSFTV